MRYLQNIFRILLGAAMTLAGIGHLSFQREEFLAQVPRWLPTDPAFMDFVVLASGVVEISLGLALIFWIKQKAKVGIALAIFYILIFPGNISQYTNGIDAFGLAPVAALSAAPSRKVKVPSFPLVTTLAARPSTQCGTSWHDRRALMAAWYCFCGSKHTPSQPMQTSKKTVFEIVTASFVPMSTYRPRSCPAKKLRYSSQSCQNCAKPGCFEAVKTLRHRS